MSEEEPVSIGELLDTLRRDLDVAEAAVDGRLAAVWGEIAGSAAAHAEVREVRSGVLTVVADDPAWASRLRHQERALLEALATRLGETIAHRMRVVVARR